jgi:acyl-CoA reductase-like NAD-dependent aldehyde dehydrogenase
MEWLINHGEKLLQPETRSSPLVLAYKKCQVHFEPLGVVAAIVSWNYREYHLRLLRCYCTV